MAIEYKHLQGGNIQRARVLVDNGYVQDTEVISELDQPANSIVVGAHFRTIDKVTIASGGSIGIEVGTSSSGNQIIADAVDSIIDAASGATDVPANFFLDLKGGTGLTFTSFSTGDEAAPAAAAGYTATDRTLFVNVKTTDHAITLDGNSRYEVSLYYLMLD